MRSANVASITTPQLILADAEAMAKSDRSLARARAVISRSYYSAFHASTIKSSFVFDSERDGGRHAQLIRHLRESSDTTLRAVGKALARLKGRRIVADYQLGNLMTLEMASEALEDARVIVIDLLEMT